MPVFPYDTLDYSIKSTANI